MRSAVQRDGATGLAASTPTSGLAGASAPPPRCDWRPSVPVALRRAGRPSVSMLPANSLFVLRQSRARRWWYFPQRARRILDLPDSECLVTPRFIRSASPGQMRGYSNVTHSRLDAVEVDTARRTLPLIRQSESYP